MTKRIRNSHHRWYKASRAAERSHSVSSMVWEYKNPSNRRRSRTYRLRSYCKNFILKKASPSDLQELMKQVEDRAEELEGVDK